MRTDVMTGEQETNEALMEAYVKGDKKAFICLFERFSPLIHRFFLRSFQNVAVADDLLQITFLKLHKARASYQVGRAFRPWFYTIASRVRLDELRKRKRKMEEASEEKLNEAERKQQISPAGEERIDRLSRIQTIRKAIEKLPESQRMVIQLHRYEEMTFAEIAILLETTEGAVKLRAFRAYERLRGELKPLLQEEKE